MEYQYSQCAKQCGIDMEETRLFPSDICDGYFGTKRFDRKNDSFGEHRIHMLTAQRFLNWISGAQYGLSPTYEINKNINKGQ